MTFLEYSALALFLITSGLQFSVSACQNIARDIGRVTLYLHGSHDRWNEQIQILHESLIPDNLFLAFVGYRVSFVTAVLLLFFAFGWIWAVLGISILFFVFPIIFSITPHIMPRYYQRVLKNIQDYVSENRIKIQQKIDDCSVSIDHVSEVIEAGIAGRRNIGLWYAELKNAPS